MVKARSLLDVAPDFSASLRQLFAVWKSDCLAALPGPIRAGLARGSAVMIIEPAEPAGYRCSFPAQPRRDADLAAFSLQERRAIGSRYKVRLRIDSDQVLATVVDLPKIAGRYLEATTRANLPVWTPFTEEEVYFASALVKSPGLYAGDRATLEVRCVSKATVQTHLAALATSGLELDEVELGGDGFVAALGSGKAARHQRLRRWSLALGLLCLIQLAALGEILSWHQEQTIEGLQAQLDSVMLTTRRRIAAANQLEAGQRSLVSLQARSQGEQSIAALFQGLAGSLPDNAWVREVSIDETRGGTVVLVSAGAVDPVAIVKRVGLFQVDEINELTSPLPGQRVYSLVLSPAVLSSKSP